MDHPAGTLGCYMEDSPTPELHFITAGRVINQLQKVASPAMKDIVRLVAQREEELKSSSDDRQKYLGRGDTGRKLQLVETDCERLSAQLVQLPQRLKLGLILGSTIYCIHE